MDTDGEDRSKEQQKDELQQYIDLKLKQDEKYLNPLSFWKQNEQTYPNLAKLAKRYFSITCSSAAVERQFSVVTQRRSNLDPATGNNVI
ncbi:unnamed protein product [Didymodactylos carnosus]|uniref:HAT C-terminal dimerisation domain-containing protein n=1 Tax=Didymodactylos carnosus TaxID=1234261 RepID=A0A815NP35_9BILA|nr:unnamed protein product [Didymodactylos carnosus]CAF4316630.1 unnamed protein product [Didymodactylos carnosus]